MPKVYSKRKSSRTSILLISLFFLLSIPFVLLGLSEKSLDTRGRAFDYLELSDNNPCIISLPNVNPYTLEVGKTVRVQVDARFRNVGITNLNIIDSTGKQIYNESFDNIPLQIGTSFLYTPSKSGAVDILGSVKKTDNGSAGCKISTPYDVKGLRAVSNNSSPEFSSNPSSSKPSQDIKTGDQYEYTLSANDKDSDRINYFYSFTPRADWLKAVVVEDGSSGKLTVTFRGSTDKPASYLANVIIHDGYSEHIRSQSWVISVSPKENDIPIVKIMDPIQAIRVNYGSSFNASWEVSDLNHIAAFQLFMTKNPTDEYSWMAVGNSLPYNATSTTVSTMGLTSGTYKLIVKATDNQVPAKFGTGISPEIIVSKTTDATPESDDVILLGDPQVTNMSPSLSDNVSNPRVTIKGTLVSSEGANIEENSISFKVDGTDITSKAKINKISDKEYTLIYQPDEDLKYGEHKAEISFKDTKGKNINKSWNFTVQNPDGDTEGTYNIFGYEIGKRTLFIIGIGLLIILLAIAVPILISLLWGGRKTKEQTVYEERVPSDGSDHYIQPTVNEDLKAKVENTVVTEEKKEEDVWSSTYDAPQPTQPQEEDVKREVTTTYVPVQPVVEEPVVKKETIVEEVPPVIPNQEEIVQSTTYVDDYNPREEEKPIVEVIPEPEIVTEKQQEQIEAPISPIPPASTPPPAPAVEDRLPEIKEDITEPIPTTPTIPPEPPAPDPSAFQKIAQQIEDQTKEDNRE